MRVALKWVVLGFGAIFTALQVIPPPVQLLTGTPNAQTVSLKNVNKPEVREILERSCKDCHSNATVVPWYGHIAPISWMLAKDVHDGRKKLNFSDWKPQGPSANEVEEMCDAISNGTMPIRSYTLIHSNAKLTKPDVDAVCSWANTLSGQRSISQFHSTY